MSPAGESELHTVNGVYRDQVKAPLQQAHDKVGLFRRVCPAR